MLALAAGAFQSRALGHLPRPHPAPAANLHLAVPPASAAATLQMMPVEQRRVLLECLQQSGQLEGFLQSQPAAGPNMTTFAPRPSLPEAVTRPGVDMDLTSLAARINLPPVRTSVRQPAPTAAALPPAPSAQPPLSAAAAPPAAPPSQPEQSPLVAKTREAMEAATQELARLRAQMAGLMSRPFAIASAEETQLQHKVTPLPYPQHTVSSMFLHLRRL